MNRLVSLLEKISNLLISYQGIQSLLNQAVKLIAEYMEIEVCSIYLYDEGSGKLMLKANVGLDQESVPKIQLRPGEGLVGMVFLENKILFEQEAHKSQYFKYFPDSKEELYPHFFAIPIVFKKKKLGVLALQTDKKKKIDEIETKLLKSLVSQLAILLKNAEIYEKLQEMTKKEGFGGQEVQQKRFPGKGVSPGVSIGKAYFIHDTNRLEDVPITRIAEDQRSREKSLFDSALDNAQKEMEAWVTQMSNSIEEIRGVLEGQIMILKDQVFQKKVLEYIDKLYTLESALKMVYEEYKIIFENMADSYFKERLLDLKDVISRILSYSYQKHEHQIFENSILVVSEMLPSYFTQIDISKIKGIVSKKTTLTSHSVILAKAFKIPMITGVKNIFSYIREGSDLILDAEKQELIIYPEEKVVEEYRNLLKNMKSFYPDQVKGKPVTKDGVFVKLSANLGLMHEIPMVLKTKFYDIGLYRTEFLFLLRKDFPGVQEQYEIYSQILKRLKGKQVTFRVLDLGGDKQLKYFPLPEEENPLLGFRSIRIFKKHPHILKIQLMALMRAAFKYSCRIMFPLVNNYEDFMFCYSLVKEAEIELKKEKENYRVPELGIMIETPASLFNLSRIAPHITFASVGTNDLLQYFLAVDRNNIYTDDAYNVYDPAFIQFLFEIGKGCRNSGLELNICGEVSGNKLMTPVLIGAGFDKLSMVPSSIPLIQQVIQKLDMETVAEICGKVLTRNKALDVETQLKKFYDKLLKEG
jgi:phosphotransferase system enzyme I (PtsP)